MRTTLTIILTLIGLLARGQENKFDDSIESATLDSLYVTALNNRFDLILQVGWQYVEINKYLNRDSNISDRFKFLTAEELIDLSIKNKKPINVIRVNHKTISPDTVDINFGILTVTAKRKIHYNNGLRFKKVEFSTCCGGTGGYEPDIRLVFNKIDNSWRIIKNRYINMEDE